MRLARLICRKDSWKSDGRCQSKAGRVGDIDWACGEDEKCLNLPPQNVTKSPCWRAWRAPTTGHPAVWVVSARRDHLD